MVLLLTHLLMVHLKVQVHLQLMLTATTEELELTTLCNRILHIFSIDPKRVSFFVNVWKPK
jgi:hypothetical protein